MPWVAIVLAILAPHTAPDTAGRRYRGHVMASVAPRDPAVIWKLFRGDGIVGPIRFELYCR